MARNFDYDLIIIGSGAAGSAAAFSAVKKGKKVAIIESGEWGGCGINSRDFPFNSAMTFSSLYRTTLENSSLGISSSRLKFNYPTFLSYQKSVRKNFGANSKKQFVDAGIFCYKGQAHFLTPFEISIGKETLSAEKFLIASGSTIDDGGISGLEAVECLTPDIALLSPKLPKSLVIIGGGATGCEFACFYASLGVEVCLIEAENHILPHEDQEISLALEKYFKKSLNVKILTETRVISVSNDAENKVINTINNSKDKSIKSEAILLATGSIPYLDFGLENARVSYNRQGIKVNKNLQTSMKHIFAAGDCIGGQSSIEKASFEGKLAVKNLFQHKKLPQNVIFPRVVDINPKIIILGKTETECQSLHKSFQKPITYLFEAPLSKITGQNTGFLKLLVDENRFLLGASIFAPHAEDFSQELLFIVQNHIPVDSLLRTPHLSTSWSSLIPLTIKKLQ